MGILAPRCNGSDIFTIPSMPGHGSCQRNHTRRLIGSQEYIPMGVDLLEPIPGSLLYNPTKPWVSKVREEDGHIAADFWMFVDDVYQTAPTKEEAWLATRRIGSILSFLGLQDAPRKRRDSSQRQGAWMGLVLCTDEGQVRLLVGEDKWLKT